MTIGMKFKGEMYEIEFEKIIFDSIFPLYPNADDIVRK